MSEVIDKQNEAINTLSRYIENFSDSENDQEVKVCSLAIPTGWGKTRIAIQSVIRTKFPEGVNPIIVLWPQKKTHIKEVWTDKRAWAHNPSAKDENLQIKQINWPDRKNGNVWRPITESIELNGGKKFCYFNGSIEKYKETIKGNNCIRSQGKGGPVVFIIDEWHSKKFIDNYKDYLKNNDPTPENAENYWKELLIPGSSRKLLIILISATPIATTSVQDSLEEEENSSVEQQTDILYEQIIESDYCYFKNLIAVGNGNYNYSLYSLYPDLIKKQNKKLRANQTKLMNDCINELINTAESNKWSDEYILLCRAIKENGNSFYRKEQMVLASNDSLKLKMCVKILSKFSEQKFVIFCHHVDVARKLGNYLKSNGFLKKNGNGIVYLDSKIQGEERENAIDIFNKSFENDSNIKVLILTDKDSQGISLHKSNAWLIHYELAWNPVRIIQRMGRVWRIRNNEDGTTDLTTPVVFNIPYSFSSEEEKLNRLERRWKILESFDNPENSALVKLAPIPMDIALGIRCTPSIF